MASLFGLFMQSLMLPVLLLLPSTQAQLPPHRADDCKWRQNVSDISDLPHHRYSVLEDCLYYFLANQADKDQGKTEALRLLPPSRWGKKADRLDLKIQDTWIRQLWMNEVWREMHINGYFQLSWFDWRLTWKPSDWTNMEKLRINVFRHLWVPDINSDRYQTSVQAGDFTTYKDVTISSKGNVTAYMEFRMQATCEVDYHNYPSDKQHCCFNLRSTLYGALIRFQVPRQDVPIKTDDLQSNWDLEDVSLEKLEQEDDPGAEQLRLCLKASRKSSTLSIELTLPMLVSAILVLVAPLIGALNHQSYVKLFAILLQFMCFQFLVSKTPQIGFGDTVPTICELESVAQKQFFLMIYLPKETAYIPENDQRGAVMFWVCYSISAFWDKFYQFTMCVTLVSLLLTLLTWSLSRIERRLPPPHSAKLFATTFNAKICCLIDRRNQTENDAEAPPSSSTKTDSIYTDDWSAIFVALNNLFSLLIVLVYVIGVLVMWV